MSVLPSDDAPVAPGGPGSKPTWSPAAKSGVGCSLSGKSRLWFTLSRGIVTEVFNPSMDHASISSLGLLVTDGQGFFAEEQSDCFTSTRMVAQGVPVFIVENECTRGRFRIFKEIFTDPARSVLLQRIKLTPMSGALADLGLFVLLSPSLGDQGEGNSGWLGCYRDWKMLFARRGGHAAALASSTGWAKRSVGFVGTSDAWQDIRQHGQMTWEYQRADKGHVALAGEIDLAACNGEFTLALSLDDTPEATAINAALSLNESFDESRDECIRQWQAWQRTVKALDSEAGLSSAKINASQRDRPDRSRPRVKSGGASDEANVYRSSMMVLRVHRAKQFTGAGVASLSIPWGEARGDDDLGGYHLVWPRDLVEAAQGLLAGGATHEAAYTINYLRATQKPSGGWPQNMWLDGSAYSDGEQKDEAALPILLTDLARREKALSDAETRTLWPMVRKAAAFIIRSGPATGQDRWENAAGLSPYTLATEIAALLVAARLASQFEEPEVAEYFRQTADLWNEGIEPWTYVQDTPLARRVGVEGYYVRIAPSPGMRTLLHGGEVDATQVVSPDALALVRFGLRAADDPRILNTVKVIDALLRIDLPAGPCWRRYNGGHYGEHDDGAPFGDHGDKAGHGRAWALLTGERGHYALAHTGANEAGKMLAAMSGFANQVGLLPEQVWDSQDIPQRDLYRGRPTGSAMPLVWAHSEYIRLMRSIRDGQVFDRPRDTWDRYVKNTTRSALSLWRFDHKADSFPQGRQLRIELLCPAVVHFSLDGWRTAQDKETRDSRLGFHVVDLPTQAMKGAGELQFTFRWPESGNRWEGENFVVRVDSGQESPPSRKVERVSDFERRAPAGARS